MTTPTNLQSVDESAANPEVPINENMVTLEWASVYGKNPATTNGLTWGYFGGRWGGFAVASGTLTLTGEGSPTQTNYLVVARATGVLSTSTVSTNWDDVANYARVYKITTTLTAVLDVEDHRAGDYGVFSNRKPLAWNPQTDNYTLALTDAENAVAMNHATAKAVNIPTNAAVAIPIGSSVIVYQEGVGATSITASGGVTLRSRATGSPTTYQAAGQYSMIVLTKRATNEWIVSGDLLA